MKGWREPDSITDLKKNQLMMVAAVIMEAAASTVKFIAVTAILKNSNQRYVSSADGCRYVCWEVSRSIPTEPPIVL